MTAANKHNVYNPSKLDSTYLRIHLFFTTACSRASKDSILFETRVRVFSGPTITSPSPDSSLNSYTHNYLFWAHVMKIMYKLLKLCPVGLRKSKKYAMIPLIQKLDKNLIFVKVQNGNFYRFLTINLDSFGSRVQRFSDSSPSPNFGLGYSSLRLESGRSSITALLRIFLAV